MVPELKELRNEIDEVDRALVALFVRRMGISGAVAQVKRQKGLPVLDRTREEQLLRRV